MSIELTWYTSIIPGVEIAPKCKSLPPLSQRLNNSIII